MTDPRYPHGSHPHGAAAPADQRPLPPGGGDRLRRIYLTLLVISAVAVLIVLSFAYFATIAAIGEDDQATLLLGSVVITVSSVCLIIALRRGHAAVHGDWATVSTAASSRSIARVGSLVGWFGALAVVAAGVVQHYQHVDLALVEGIVLGVTALIPAVSNDSANRIARNITG